MSDVIKHMYVVSRLVTGSRFIPGVTPYVPGEKQRVLAYLGTKAIDGGGRLIVFNPETERYIHYKSADLRNGLTTLGADLAEFPREMTLDERASGDPTKEALDRILEQAKVPHVYIVFGSDDNNDIIADLGIVNVEVSRRHQPDERPPEELLIVSDPKTDAYAHYALKKLERDLDGIGARLEQMPPGMPFEPYPEGSVTKRMIDKILGDADLSHPKPGG